MMGFVLPITALTLLVSLGFACKRQRGAFARKESNHL